MNKMMPKVTRILSRIKAECLEKQFSLHVIEDQIYIHPEKGGRLYIQVKYSARCTKTGTTETWHGRKWYLSEYMTTDEIIKTAYAAYRAAIEHEMMEGFKLDGNVLFNPHVDSEKLALWRVPEVSRTRKSK
jgi:hypothetical protein